MTTNTVVEEDEDSEARVGPSEATTSEQVITEAPSGAIHPSLPFPEDPPLFTTEQLGVDRRLIVNRKRQIKMYRVWMQGKFRKL